MKEKFSQIPTPEERPLNQSYEALRDEAPRHAEALIARVENFEKMNHHDQLSELQVILDTLEEDNGNRFIEEYIAGKMYHIEVTAQEEKAANQAERSAMPETPPADYPSPYILVPQADKQPLSPAAGDNHPPTPDLRFVS